MAQIRPTRREEPGWRRSGRRCARRSWVARARSAAEESGCPGSRRRGPESVAQPQLGFDVPAVAQGTRGAGGPRGRDAEASVACVLHQRAWHRGPRTGESGVIVRGFCTQAHELGPRPDGFRCACPASCRRNWSPCRQHDVIGTRSSVCVRFPETVRRTSPARASTHLAGTEEVHCREAAIVRARTRARVAQSRRLDISGWGWSA